MVIVFYDGGRLYCNHIEMTEKNMIADDCRIVPIIEVQRIVMEGEEYD